MYLKFVGIPFEDAHDASYDVNATAEVFFKALCMIIYEYK